MKHIITLLLIFLAFGALRSEEGRILRFPNASRTQIAFCYAGDVYTVPIAGGLARRVTSCDGTELFPRFSPDGSLLAFSAEYDGNREIYTMPSTGGEPQRLTYSMDLRGIPDRLGPDKIIMQWTADGSKVIYRSRQESWNAWVGKLYMQNIKGGLPEEVPLPKSGFASYSPDMTKLAYNRVCREFRTWKRYRGGQADDIWIYDFNTKKLENITNNSAQDIIPMWWKNKIYFLSDRDKVMNLFVYDLNTKQTTKITSFDYYDVKFPSLGADNIAFENAGYVYILDCNTDKYQKISIEIAGDFPDSRSKIINVKNRINDYDLAPDGTIALFSARGEVFTAPADKGIIKNLTQSPGAHDRDAVWSPDGLWIAFVSDRSGEEAIWKIKPDGSQLTQLVPAKKDKSESPTHIWELAWSPDSKKILFGDKMMNLNYFDLDKNEIVKVAHSKDWEIRNFCWSPDSKWIAYSDNLENNNSAVFLYSLTNAQSYQVTDEFFNSSNPEFSSDGKYLFFTSDRSFNPRVGNIEWNFQYDDMSKIFALTLQDTLMSPFAFKSTETDFEKAKAAKDEKDDKKSKKKKDKDDTESTDKTIKIDLPGIKDRLFEIPVSSADYSHLRSVDSHIYYNKWGTIHVFDLAKKEESKVADFGSWELSSDRKKIMYYQNGDYYLTELKESIKTDKDKIDLGEMTMTLNRKEEWKQIYDECWRQMRDFFYAPNMHGVDWADIKNKYGALVPYVNHRADLTYLIGEMIGELNVGHAYVGGGDMPSVDQVGIGLLGASYTFDPQKSAYKITKILKGRNWDENTRSPLTEPGIDIKVGDYIYELDGKKLSEKVTPYSALLNRAGKYVNIKYSSGKADDQLKEITVKTISSEKGLNYFNWVEGRRAIVDSLSKGTVGYVHIPDMSFDGLNEFVKYFYPQIRKKALIVDDRYNGGGNVSPMIIERLRRILLLVKNVRNQESIGTNPDYVMTGPIVCLLNELSASDGDLFPYQFKQAGIGTLIGKRSWGGVIGIRGSLPNLDGGYLMKPEFAHFGTDGNWMLEGVGMKPDIDVDNDPTNEYNGIDDQLNKAIEVIMEQIKTDKKPKIPEKIPDYPNKK